MVEECFGRARYKFEKDDKVAFASRAAYAKYQSKDIKVPYLDEPRELHRNEFVVRSGTSECFDYVGKVVKVLPNGDVEVEFSRNAICIIEPDALVKMPFPVTGSLVRLVDDIRPDGNLQLIHMEFPYDSRTDVCGGMCIVLDDGCMNPNGIPVTLGKKFGFVSLLHLDFIARPLYMDFRRTLLICEFSDGDSETWLKEVHEDLKNFLTQLPDVDISSIVANSPFAPGDIVKVISDVTKHISWQVQQYQMNVHGPFHQAFLEMWYDPEEHRLRSDRRLASTLLAECLLEPGEVVQVNHNGDTIVMFSNGWVWCVRSSCLQLADSSEACSEAAGRRVATNISRTVDDLICSTLSLQNVELHGECLRVACFSGNKALLEQMLLGSNMSLETEDENGNKPLHYAAQGNQPEILEFLIRCGANINATNKRSRTALHYAVQERLVKCVRELTKRQETLDINIQDDNGNSPFLVAAANGYPEIGNELVQLPNVDFTITNKCGLNALHIAAFKGHSWLVKMILSKESNLINSQQEELGYTALHFAVSRGHKDVVAALLTHESCAVDIPNKDEETPLLLAAEKGHWSIAAKLLLAGANVNKGDGHGDTVLHICLKKDKYDRKKPWDYPSTCAMRAECGERDMQQMLQNAHRCI